MLIMQVFLRSIKRLPNYNLHKLRVLQLSLRGSKPIQKKRPMYLNVFWRIYKPQTSQYLHQLSVYGWIHIQKALIPLREPPRAKQSRYMQLC